MLKVLAQSQHTKVGTRALDLEEEPDDMTLTTKLDEEPILEVLEDRDKERIES